MTSSNVHPQLIKFSGHNTRKENVCSSRLFVNWQDHGQLTQPHAVYKIKSSCNLLPNPNDNPVERAIKNALT